jgi:hypothetical protein
MTCQPAPGRACNFAARTAVRAQWLALCLGATLSALALGCGEAADPEGLDSSEPQTIAECQAWGGSPLFDPRDGRSIEMSCPEGLRFLGQFDEPFFGSDGGICCTGLAQEERGALEP